MQKRMFYHIAFWTVYVLFKAYMNYNLTAKSFSSYSIFEVFMVASAVQFVYLAAKIPMIYGQFFIIERFLSKKWSLFSSVLAFLSAYIYGILTFFLLSHYVVEKGLFHTEGVSDLSFQSIVYIAFLLSFTCGIALAIKLIRINIREKEAEQEKAKQRLETELRFLKAQTNPHFLFNTLNNIYALARKKSDDTADVVMKLSKLLRFMLYETQKPFIPIADELKVIESYIELEKIRYNDRLEITFNMTIDNPETPIAPLILLPFIENAFKHGAGETMYESFIHIEVKLQNEALYFCVENAKSEDTPLSISDKIGLNNIKRQLELLYSEHILDIENKASTFKIVLQLNLNNHAKI